MVHRKSEYQNEFKSSVTKTHQPTYLENLTFRHNRRDREFLHTPIYWDEQEDEEELSSDDNANYQVKSKTAQSDESQYQSLAEILAESSKKNEAFRQKKGKSVSELDIGRISLDSIGEKENVSDVEQSILKTVGETVDFSKDSLEKQTDIDTITKQKVIVDADEELDIDGKDRLKDRDCKSYACDSKKQKSLNQPASCNHTRSSGNKSTKGTGKPKRPDRQGVIPGTTRLPRSSINAALEKPPFVSYGVGDKEPTLATHRTHNVRSSADVYAHALKAQRVREAERRRRQKEKQRAVQSTNALLEKLATVTPRDSQSWQSEYRKQFHGYEPQEYERAVSSRAVISRSLTPINAVHRGGCLLVHVD